MSKDDEYTDAEAVNGPYVDNCWHIAIVSLSEKECQCMDCLRIFPKDKNFKSDYPEYDRY